MEAIKISLDDYVLTGAGGNGESFCSKSDPDVLLKLYLPGREGRSVEELSKARKVFALGIPTPEPGELVVTEDGRHGILFRRIRDKKSYSRATADEPSKVAQYASEFAEMCLQLHGIHVDTSEFESVKDCYYQLLEESPFFTAAEKDKLCRFIADAPDADTAIHGDLQFSNAIFVADKRYFIDLGDFCYGYRLFDVGMVYLCCVLSDEPFVKEYFNMPKALAVRFWEHFAPAYFGTDRPLRDIEEEILPYAGLKNLIIERDIHAVKPWLRLALNPILN